MRCFNKTRAALLMFAAVMTFSLCAESITINWDETRQEIDGFGAFGGYGATGAADPFTPEGMDITLDTVTGCGFSILRWEFPMADALSATDIYYAYNDAWPYMKMAQEYGCTKFLYSAWSCPGWMKTNNQLADGGHLKPEYFRAYADTAVKFFRLCIDEGGFDSSQLYFSFTNEPNLAQGYPSMHWTPEEIHDFVDTIGPLIKPMGVKILMPEQERWSADLAELTLEDENTRQYIDVVAGHGYWWNRDGQSDPGEPLPFETAQKYGIKTWETEICNTAPQCPTNMENGLMWGENIHRYMVNAEVNAWLWWWIMTKVTVDEEALQCFDGTWRKLTWVIGQYARFVRPGFFRITTDAANDGVPVLLTAYKEKHTGNFAIVVLNQGSATSLDVTFNGCAPTKVTPWTTTDAANIEKGSDITVTDGSFTASLPGLSATTFVGTGTPTVEVKAPATVNFEKGKTDFCVTGRILTLSDNLIGKALTVSAYSINGRLLNQITVSGKGSSRIELPKTSAGANLIQIKTENGITVKKIINR